MVIRFSLRGLLSRSTSRQPAARPLVAWRPTSFAAAESRDRHGVIRLRVRGDIDLSSRDRLGTLLMVAIASDAVEVCVDLADVEFLDCSGIGALVIGRITAAWTGCRFRVVNATGVVARVLDATGMAEALDCDPRIRSTGRRGDSRYRGAWLPA